MGSRNFGLGARDMKAAGRIALEEGMQSFSSIDTMADRWNLFVDYVREHHGFGRMAVQLRKSLDVARERDRKAREQIAQELGHNRIDVTNAYLGR